jgi:AraC-like DNA-binding protein/mannose-6-phosphate isomerase-like protein (cupin superfamily)
MNEEELDKILRSPSEAEGKTNEIREAIKEIDILPDDYFIAPNEKITFSRHPRFIEFPAHRHNFIELIFVYSGNITQIINGKQMVLNEGDVCILDTNVVHAFEAVGENDLIINVLMRKNYFNSALLSRLSNNSIMSDFLINAIYKNTKNNYIVFPGSSNGKVRNFMTALLCEHYEKSMCHDEIINCYIILLFSELLTIYKNSEKKKTTNKEKVSISDLINYIESNYQTATLEKTAKYFNYHPNYLSRLLKEHTSKNFKQIITEQKLKEAALLLENTDLPIDVICKEIGYENLSFFYKKFKEMFECRPLTYRKLKQG